jgi:hypothetical protein
LFNRICTQNIQKIQRLKQRKFYAMKLLNLIPILYQSLSCIQGKALTNFTSTALRSKRSTALAFDVKFAELLQENIDNTATKLDFTTFQRSVCLLDLFESSKRSAGTVKTRTGVKLDDVKTALAYDIKRLFEQKDSNDCRDCGTSIMIRYAEELSADIEGIYETIETGTSKEGGVDNELFEIQHDLGEAGYIIYKVFYQTENIGSSGCTPMELLVGSCKVAGSSVDDISVNLGWFVYYSEHKFTVPDDDNKKKFRKLRDSLIANFNRYNMIVRAAEQTFLDIKMPYIKDFAKYERFLADVTLQKTCIENGNAPDRCLLPICNELLEDSVYDEIDQVFVMDCTGSMGSYINTAKNKILSLKDDVLSRHNGTGLRLGFVGYRDITDWGEAKQYIQIPFTDNHVRFQQQLTNSVVASGGGDHAEDVYSGLEAASRMDWNSDVRMLTLMADAPHNEGTGRKRYADFATILNKLASDAEKDGAVFVFSFFNIGSNTRDMGDRLKKMMPGRIVFIEHRLNNDGSSAVISYMDTVLGDVGAAMTRKIDARSFF